MFSSVPRTATSGSDAPLAPLVNGTAGSERAVEGDQRDRPGAAQLELDGHGGHGRHLALVLAAVDEGEGGAGREPGQVDAVLVHAVGWPPGARSAR